MTYDSRVITLFNSIIFLTQIKKGNHIGYPLGFNSFELNVRKQLYKLLRLLFSQWL